MAKDKVYKVGDGSKMRQSKKGAVTNYYYSSAEGAGPKGFKKKLKIKDKKLVGGGQSTTLQGASDKTMKEFGPDSVQGKNLRKGLKDYKDDSNKRDTKKTVAPKKPITKRNYALPKTKSKLAKAAKYGL
tara:strand:+ start:423 stop:809 length:387 start_codon:yes stop_codon:yes gene_type:complete